MSHHIGLYGNVALERALCPICCETAFVIDGEYTCCRLKVKSAATHYKRMTNPEAKRMLPTAKERAELLEQFQHSCAYCDRAFGAWVHRKGKIRRLSLAWDHQVPYSYSQNNEAHNFLPACNVCNGYKSDKIFTTVEEVRVYVALRWQIDED